MPTLDQLLERSRLADPIAATVQEIARLGYLGDVDPQAMAAVATGKAEPDEVRGSAIESAVAEYQQTWKSDLDELARRTYGREAKVDGTIGRATLESVLNRTCGVPDRLFADDGTLIPMEAKWPDSCVNDVGFWLDQSKYGSSMGLTFTQFKAVFVRALDHIKSFAKIGFHVTEDRAKARMYVGFENLSGSTLAWSHLANNHCGDKEQRYTRRTWADHYAFLVIVHECLHAAGCPHTPGNYVMNPSIVATLPGMTDRDVENLLSQGYAKADPKPQPDPDPKPPGDPPGRSVGVKVTLTDGTTVPNAKIARVELDLDLTN